MGAWKGRSLENHNTLLPYDMIGLGTKYVYDRVI